MDTQAVDSAKSTYDYSTRRAQKNRAERNASSRSKDTSFGADIREKIAALLEDVPRSGNGKLTFDAVIEYRDNLKADFEAKAKAGLKKLGVDTERDMVFAYDGATDTLTVDGNHPDKKIIDQYFAAHDEERHQFAKVVALNNVTNAAQSKLSPAEMRTSLQVQAMAWWTESNTENVFGGGNLLTTGSGQSSFVGLDMRV